MDAIPILFINLDRAAERRRFLERQGRALGLVLERFPALTPVDIPANQAARLSRLWERPITGPELALFLSHKALWQRAAESSDGLVVLEDDAVLSPRLPAFLADPPRSYDLCNLEHAGRRKFFRRVAPVQHAVGRLSLVARDKSGSAAYYVSPRGAERLLMRAERLAAPSDAFLFSSGLDMVQAEPALAVQAHILKGFGVDPGIDVSTQIHQPRARLPVTRETVPFHMRRLATQVRLARLQLARAWTLQLREPELNVGEFAQALAAADAQSDS
ncbi:glycosyltransferase family 25 protein [Antarcticirhabdus aurantiaca]|uniref:Glycosyltransferase family 25 protein n=1 Tax=Antarcticirhabdus aurantiaca TaxID=2606717 RepID=A0ACD4NHD5_9HYPH|nr:glycosyltransferase family 25 protein [Antarcticirhabdus aurantiaca]WAJ26235.1 glycosyltransferase family 25 protein [Jeongeuplla avenae]